MRSIFVWVFFIQEWWTGGHAGARSTHVTAPHAIPRYSPSSRCVVLMDANLRISNQIFKHRNSESLAETLASPRLLASQGLSPASPGQPARPHDRMDRIQAPYVQGTCSRHDARLPQSIHPLACPALEPPRPPISISVVDAVIMVSTIMDMDIWLRGRLVAHV